MTHWILARWRQLPERSPLPYPGQWFLQATTSLVLTGKP